MLFLRCKSFFRPICTRLLRPICIEQAARRSLYSFKYILDPLCNSFRALTLLFFQYRFFTIFRIQLLVSPTDQSINLHSRYVYSTPLHLVYQLTMRKLLIGPYFIFLVVFVGVVLVRDSFARKWSASYSEDTL